MIDSLDAAIGLSILTWPLLGALAVLIPGGWWRETRRHQILLGALLASALAAITLLLEQDPSAPPAPASPQLPPSVGIVVPVLSLVFSFDPSRLLLVLAVLGTLIVVLPLAFADVTDARHHRNLAAACGFAAAAQLFVILNKPLLGAWVVAAFAAGMLQGSPLRLQGRDGNVSGRLLQTLFLAGMAGFGGGVVITQRLELTGLGAYLGTLQPIDDALARFLAKDLDAHVLRERHAVLAGAAILAGLSALIGLFTALTSHSDSHDPGLPGRLALLLPSALWLLLTLRPFFVHVPALQSAAIAAAASAFPLAALVSWAQPSAVRIAGGMIGSATLLWTTTLAAADRGAAAFRLLLLLCGTCPLLIQSLHRRRRLPFLLSLSPLLVVAVECRHGYSPWLWHSLPAAEMGDQLASSGMSEPFPRIFAGLLLAGVGIGAAILGGCAVRLWRSTRVDRSESSAVPLADWVWLALLNAVALLPVAEGIAGPVDLPVIRSLSSSGTDSLPPLLAVWPMLMGGAIALSISPRRAAAWTSAWAPVIRFLAQGFAVGRAIHAIVGFVVQSFQSVLGRLEERFADVAALRILPLIAGAADRWHHALQSEERRMALLSAALAATILAIAFFL